MSTKRTSSTDHEGSVETQPPKSLIRKHRQVKRARYRELFLDKLPVDILNSILGYLEQPDLVSVCLVSKPLYKLARKRLYTKVTIVDECYFEDDLPMPNSNYYTMVPNGTKDKFLATVSRNKQIAQLIKSLTISDSIDMDEYSGLSEFLRKLLPRVRLEFFHCTEETYIPYNCLSTVQRISLYVHERCVLSSNLVELKITYRGWSSDIHNFSTLAHEMVEDKSYLKLKKLAFKTWDYHANLGMMSEDEILTDGPFWSNFFCAFEDDDIVLHLTDLGLDGDFWDDDQKHLARLVSDVVDFSKLETLDIKYSYYVRFHNEGHHEDGVHSFLDYTTKGAFRLRNLTITHTRVITPGEINALARVLRENLSYRLKHLRITFQDQCQQELAMIQDMLLTYQTSLVKLKIAFSPLDLFNPLTLEDEDRKFIGVPALRELQEAIISDKGTREALSPTIFDYDECKPFLDEEHLSTIISHKKEILEFLKSDNIYLGAADVMPALKEYDVLGLCINMKENTIIFNGKSISLKE
ncbi:hypothetical protein JCM33374_g3127 [Metschnikowia sp. JCM 33374]|nr:hypothetical protein JCM33374_g3127 [Metschnikowia sp. JCM 33374]